MIGWITVPDPISSREAELARQLKESQEQLRQANVRIALLEAKIDLLLRKLFGAKSESSIRSSSCF